MAFPATTLPLRGELFLAGAWTDIATYMLARNGIQSSRGIPDEGVRADPARFGVSLRNTDGRFSPRNPLGAYFGSLGRNTPLRLVLDVADDDFNRTVANGWGTSSSGQTWTTVGGDAADYAVSAGTATIAVDTVNSQRLTVLDVNEADVEIVATLKPGVVATGGPIQFELMVRYQDSANFYRGLVTFNTDATMTVAVTATKDGVTDGSVIDIVNLSGTYGVNTQMRLRVKVSGTIPTIAAKAWDATSPEPFAFQARATDNNTNAITSSGDVGVRAIFTSANTNPLPVTLSVSDMDVVHHRANVEVPVWPPRSDVSENDVWVPIQASGPLRRLTASTSVASPLRRTIASLNPDAYWPLEDGANATEAGSGLDGGTPMTASGTITWAAIDDIPGSLPAPDMLRAAGKLVGAVPAPVAATGQWSVLAVISATAPTPSWPVLTWRVTGSLYVRYELSVASGETLDLIAYASDGAATVIYAGLAVDGVFSAPASLMVQATTSGSDTQYETYFNGQSIDFQIGTGIATGQLYEIELTGRAESSTEIGGLCHVAGWHNELSSVLDTGAIGDAVTAFDGEQANVRLARLAAEDGFATILIGDESEQMGPQQIAPTSSLIDACVDVDKGLLSEARDEFALVYRTVRSRYNQAATLALTYTSRQVFPPFEPVEDDAGVVNDLTVSRRGGVRGARFQQTTGALSVNDPPDGIGRYQQSKTLDLHTDSQAAQHASWEVFVATWDEARYPSVHVSLASVAISAPSVFTAAKRLDVGDRLTIVSPPSWLPSQQIDTQALELVEVFGEDGGGGFAWDIYANAVPNGPYAVGVAGDESTAGAWSQTGEDTQLVSALASGATSALVHSDGPVFTTDATELVYSPLGVALGGEVCPVPSTPQARDTFTRSESNGWGTSTSGSAWTTTGGNAADYSVNGTEGVITLPTGDLFTRNATLPEVYTDVDMRFTVQLAQLATGDEIRAYALLRCTGVDSCYRVEMQFEVPGHIDVNLQSEVSGSVTTLATASQVAAYSADSDVFVHAQMHGSRLRVKIWTGDADLPPTEWTVEAVGATFSSGQIGIRAQLSGGNTNVNPVVRFDNLWVGEAGIKSALLDTFSRTEISGWNSPDIGPAWTVVDGTATDITVSGGVGQHSMSAAGAELEVALDVAWPDLDIIITDVTWPVTPTGAGNPAQRLKARFVDVDNFVEIGVFRITSDTITTRLRQEIAGVETGTGFVALSGATSTTTVSVRLQAIGSTLRAKVWAAADPEPDAWRHSLTTTLLSGGQIKLRTAAPAGSTNVFPLVATYDNIEVTYPQTIELTRTVAKIHAAGTIVQVSKPLVASL